MRKIFAALAVMVCLVPAAAAERVTFAFTGRVTEVNALATLGFTELGVVTGAPFHGEYVFESSTPSSPGVPGSFRGAILEARIQIAGWTLQGPTSNAFTNRIDVSPTSYSVTMGVDDAPDLIPSIHAGTTVEFFFSGADPPAFENTELPLQPPDLSLFDMRFARVLGGGGAAGRVSVVFEVESLKRVPDRVEEILGIRVQRNGIIFQVTSNGCTHKEDFEVVVFEDAILRIALIRTRPDSCRQFVPLGRKLRFSHAEMGFEPGEEFVVINPRAPVSVSESRARRGLRSH